MRDPLREIQSNFMTNQLNSKTTYNNNTKITYQYVCMVCLFQFFDKVEDSMINSNFEFGRSGVQYRYFSCPETNLGNTAFVQPQM